MTLLSLLAVLLALGLAGFVLGQRRALSSAGGDLRRLHSRPVHHGWHVALASVLPAFLLLLLWLVLQPLVLGRLASAHLPPDVTADPAAVRLLVAEVTRLARAPEAALGGQGAEASARLRDAVRAYREAAEAAALWRAVAVISVAALGLFLALRRIAPEFRARNRVERVLLGLLMLAALIAILTTLGIIWSLLSESVSFFTLYPLPDFFLGLTWSPKFGGGSELGFLPLFWGTLYITVIALLVAVPLGLLAAVHLSEYASPRVRAWVKPLLEVIAGIPTVAYGLFALVTLGPFLRDVLAEPLGLGTSGASVLNAGIVIGILNIPFISSLSDDILNAVPQSLRDGSCGIGATRSETIRQVVLPAALPGIAGAILMAASRAIGETMIVVMGAGAAAKLSLNPFEAMTTMTVKIVGQLTGDTDFHSAETLVAFALGMTLFGITLALNILAVWIVRRYREQYE